MVYDFTTEYTKNRSYNRTELTSSANIKKVDVKSVVFTWSNLISFSRIFVAVPIIWLHRYNGMQITWLIGALVAYGIISDYLDGYVARKTDTISEWGKILDPLADKISATLLFLYAVVIGYIPLWFLLVEVIRDLIIVSGSLYIMKLRGKAPMAVTSGKWSINVLTAYWMSVFFLPEMLWLQYFLMVGSLAFMLFSLIDYLQRFKQIINGMKFN